MKKNKKTISIILQTTLFALAVTLLVSYNLEKNYKIGDYIKAENAYYAEKIDDPTGYIKAEKFVSPSDDKYDIQKTRSLGSNLIGDIETVWSSYTGAGTTIAIIDDGFDYNHPEFTRSDGTSAILSTSRYYYLSGSTVYYKSYADEATSIAQDWESDEQAWASHGTATATTAAAPMDNGGGVGVAPEANILALKVDFYLSSIKAAIQYAITQNVDVINMSLGAYAESFTDGWGDQHNGYPSTATYLDSVCLSAYNAGIIVVAAAGNEATWRKSYPASNKNVIGVGALGDWDNKGNPHELAEFTNYISTSQTGDINVDILAPGYVYTAHQKGTKNAPTHTYADTQGTSFSSPIVAGAAALWKQKYPEGTPSEFLYDLQDSADGKGTYANKMIKVSGWVSSLNDVGPSNITNGRVNVANLLDITNPYVTTKQINLNITVGEKRQIALSTYNGTITYSSSNNNVATVSNNGLVEGQNAGSTTIVVTATKDGKTATASVDVNVAPIIAVDDISFNPPSITLNVGETYDAAETMVLTPNSASPIFLFDSADESVATIDEDSGLITAVGVGSTEIDVIAVYGEGYATLLVNVENTTPQSGFLNFGSTSGRFKVDGSSVSSTDNLNNLWLITTTGTTSFTQNSDNSQIGSAKNPASTIEFKLTLPNSVTFTSVNASFGGNKESSAAVTIKVGSTQIGTGSVPASADRTITNTSTASGNSLTISLTNISKGIKVYSISYAYGGSNSGGEITPPTLEDVLITNNKTYRPGETINKNDINVVLAYSDGSSSSTTNFVFPEDGYEFTYEDTLSGGAASQKQFLITYGAVSYNFTVNVTRAAYQMSSGITTTISSAQFNAADLSKSIDDPSNPLVTISGIDFTVTTNAYVFSQSGYYLSFGKNAGSIHNTNAFNSDLTAISVTQKSGARQDGVLTISTDGITWLNYSANKLAKGGYRYFKYAYLSNSSASGAASYSNIQTISFTLSGQESATSVANFIMYEDTADQCLTKLPLVIEKLNNMSSVNKNTFWTSEEYVIHTARERLFAWARHEGVEIIYTNDTFELTSKNAALIFPSINSEDNIFSFVTILFFGFALTSTLFLLQRKKEDL